MINCLMQSHIISSNKMDIEKQFHMTEGTEENSYAKNSSYQKNVADMVKHITTETLQEVYLALRPNNICIADLGCSSGTNSLSIIKDCIKVVEDACCGIMLPAPEFSVFLNDLTSNDFNLVFKSLPNFLDDLKKERNGTTCPIFLAGNPGSFYGRLFPRNCLHFVYSSFSLHWLSKVPPGIYDEQGKPINKGNIYVSESSPPLMSQAYFAQFQEDFKLFLQSRSEEVTSGGRMVLILLGRIDPGHAGRGNSFWGPLSRSLAILVSKGDIQKETLDSFDLHFYAPSKEEIEAEISSEGSFELDLIKMFETEREYDQLGDSYGREVAMTARAALEPMLQYHFGGGLLLDTLFDIYERMIVEEVLKEDLNPIAFVLVLRKL